MNVRNDTDTNKITTVCPCGANCADTSHAVTGQIDNHRLPGALVEQSDVDGDFDTDVDDQTVVTNEIGETCATGTLDADGNLIGDADGDCDFDMEDMTIVTNNLNTD